VKDERGAIIIEGTLILPFFMFAIITVLSIVNICFAQAKIGTALNETAKEISEYSYLYGLTGLDKKQQQLYAEGENARASIDQISSGVSELFSAASSIGNTVTTSASDPLSYSDAYNSISGDIESGQNGISNISGGAESLVSDPTSILKMLENEGIEWLKSYIVSKMAPVFVKKHMVRSSTDSSESFLKYLGIVPKDGSYMDGLDFGDSVIFLNGSEEIKIIARYQIQVIQLLGIDIKLDFVQCGATKAWFEGERSTISSETGSDKELPSGEDETQTDADGGGDEEDEETSSSSIKSASEYAKDATRNDKSDIVILGKYSNSEAGESYIDSAIRYEATYFDLEDYDEIRAQTDDNFMWSINEEFLKQQYSEGKRFYLTDNPDTATGTFAKEVSWLKSHGYTFKLNGLGFWEAVKEP